MKTFTLTNEEFEVMMFSLEVAWDRSHHNFQNVEHLGELTKGARLQFSVQFQRQRDETGELLTKLGEMNDES